MTISTNISAFKDNELFRSAFDYASIGMALVARDGLWLDVNASVCRITGYSREELLQTTFQNITHPDDLEKDLNLLHRMLAGEIEHYEMEKRYIHKAGHVVWILLNVSAVRDEARQPLFFISQIQDITERISLRNEVIRRRRVVENILNNTASAIARFDRDCIYLYGNQRLAEILGVSLGEIIGKKLGELTHIIPYATRIEEKIAQVFAAKTTLTFESQRVVQGAKVYLFTYLTPEFDEKGEVETVVGLSTNITQLKETENELRRRESEMRSILHQTQIVIARYDRECRHLYLNHRVNEEIGQPIDVLLGKTFGDIGLDNHSTQAVESAVRQAFSEKKTVEMEIDNFISPEVRHYFVRFSPEFDRNAEVETVLCVGFDVTALKTTENDLRQALAQVKQLQSILPICSYCRNIRDVKDYWHTVENYISTHTDAKFSHGICPQCYDSHLKPQLEILQGKKSD